jgi:hypothetical protein
MAENESKPTNFLFADALSPEVIYAENDEENEPNVEESRQTNYVQSLGFFPQPIASTLDLILNRIFLTITFFRNEGFDWSNVYELIGDIYNPDGPYQSEIDISPRIGRSNSR